MLWSHVMLVRATLVSYRKYAGTFDCLEVYVLEYCTGVLLYIICTLTSVRQASAEKKRCWSARWKMIHTSLSVLTPSSPPPPPLLHPSAPSIFWNHPAFPPSLGLLSDIACAQSSFISAFTPPPISVMDGRDVGPLPVFHLPPALSISHPFFFTSRGSQCRRCSHFFLKNTK